MASPTTSYNLNYKTKFQLDCLKWYLGSPYHTIIETAFTTKSYGKVDDTSDSFTLFIPNDFRVVLENKAIANNQTIGMLVSQIVDGYFNKLKSQISIKHADCKTILTDLEAETDEVAKLTVNIHKLGFKANNMQKALDQINKQITLIKTSKEKLDQILKRGEIYGFKL